MNLTDGKVLCGRRYFDGSGGNNHALQHFQETGYPLAVKLGTITPDGAGKTHHNTQGLITYVIFFNIVIMWNIISFNIIF